MQWCVWWCGAVVCLVAWCGAVVCLMVWCVWWCGAVVQWWAGDLKVEFDPGSWQLLGERGSTLSLTLPDLYGL